MHTTIVSDCKERIENRRSVGLDSDSGNGTFIATGIENRTRVDDSPLEVSRSGPLVGEVGNVPCKLTVCIRVRVTPAGDLTITSNRLVENIASQLSRDLETTAVVVT